MSDGSEQVSFYVLGGAVFVAIPLVLALPAALLVHSRRPAWFDRVAGAADGRRTACLLSGAGFLLASAFVSAVLWNAKPLRLAAVVVLLSVLALLLAGFAAGAWNQGRRMLRRDDGVSCLVIGWLARAGAAAVPLLWPVVAAYLVSAACGAPLVALLSRPEGNSTTEPSAGRTPAN